MSLSPFPCSSDRTLLMETLRHGIVTTERKTIFTPSLPPWFASIKAAYGIMVSQQISHRVTLGKMLTDKPGLTLDSWITGYRSQILHVSLLDIVLLLLFPARC